MHIDRLLDGAVAEGLVADNVAAGIFKNCGSHDLSRARGAAIYQHSDGKLSDVFGGIGVKGLAGIFLPLQVGDGAVIEEEVGGRDALGLLATRGVAQVEDELLSSLLLQIANLARRSPATCLRGMRRP